MSAFGNVAYTIGVAPLVSWWTLGVLGGLALLVVGLGLWRRARGAWWRAFAVAVLLAALLNPALIAERREARPDVALVVVDQSPSQQIGERRQQTEAALTEVERKLGQLPDLEYRVVRVTGSRLGAVGEEQDGTRLFQAIERALANLPRQRLAGIVVVTDGEVHDLPDAQRDANRRNRGAGAPAPLPGPIHTLLTGRPGEADRRLAVARAPSYGLVGKPVTVTVKVEDLPQGPGGSATVLMRRDGQHESRVTVPVGRDHDITFTLDHGGATVVEFEVEAGPRELTLENNRAVVAINGVRDRLRVLLVSGEPHAGERTWRDLLKADPSVDLIHFTILRPPEKQDGTPIRELSLIAFPVRELFEVKLDEFNLIIFDRYRHRGVLPRSYLANVADYVNKGGALLEGAGPTFASQFGLYRSPLGAVLPGEPTGRMMETGFRAALTDLGKRHPVTAGLPGADRDPAAWGRWFRQIDAEPRRGSVVMQGVENRPLLILDRVGSGRVAQLLSDHVWLWSRGYEGGGPQAELLRRLAHWLMKEPELEENVLKAMARGDRMEISRRALEPSDRPIEVTTPTGRKIEVKLGPEKDGRAEAVIEVEEPGLYRLNDGQRTALAAVGALNSIEYADVRATDALLRPIVEATGGGLRWLSDGGVPELRRVRPARQLSGRDWFGLVRNGDYAVTGLDETSLMPALGVLALALGALAFAWRREGK